MPDVLVVDASALCKLLRNEPESDAVERRLRDHLTAGGEAWSDAIAAVEVVTCARHAVDAGEGSPDALAQAAQDALAVVRLVDRPDPAAADLRRLLAVAVPAGATGPDARYLELAKGHRLLTFDRRQAEGARRLGIALEPVP